MNKIDPKRKGEAPRLVVRVPEPILDKLERARKAEGLDSISALVRRLLRDFTEGKLVRNGGKA